jgi:hypothetical protein
MNEDGIGSFTMVSALWCWASFLVPSCSSLFRLTTSFIVKFVLVYTGIYWSKSNVYELIRAPPRIITLPNKYGIWYLPRVR